MCSGVKVIKLSQPAILEQMQGGLSQYFWSLLVSLASSLLQASVVENTTVTYVILLSQGTMQDKFFWQFLQLCTLPLEVSLSRPSNTEAARTTHLFPPTSIYCPHEENQVGPWKQSNITVARKKKKKQILKSGKHNPQPLCTNQAE